MNWKCEVAFGGEKTSGKADRSTLYGILFCAAVLAVLAGAAVLTVVLVKRRRHNKNQTDRTPV